VSTSYTIASSPTDQLSSLSRSEYGASTSTRSYTWDVTVRRSPTAQRAELRVGGRACADQGTTSG